MDHMAQPRSDHNGLLAAKCLESSSGCLVTMKLTLTVLGGLTLGNDAWREGTMSVGPFGFRHVTWLKLQRFSFQSSRPTDVRNIRRNIRILYTKPFESTTFSGNYKVVLTFSSGAWFMSDGRRLLT